jgi:hypothetical protein
LQCDAIPTLFLPKNSSVNASTNSSGVCTSKRSQRMQTKNDLENRKIIIAEILAAPSNISGEQGESEAVAEQIDKDASINMCVIYEYILASWLIEIFLGTNY